jgi:GT2 family glycosyltransferase
VGEPLLPAPLISVIIVNWNGRQHLTECLDSLRAQTFRDFETIVVDNASHDGSAGMVKEQYPEVKLVVLEKNRGFAGGNNAGIAIASGTYIALLNNDTSADSQWLSELAHATLTQSPSPVGMWASKILNYDNRTVIDNVGLLLYPDGLARGKGRLEQDRGQYDGLKEALLPSGCAGLYRRAMLDETGLFDEVFFAYADDVDLGLRGRLAGWGCTFVSSAVVYHKYSSSSSAYSPLKAFLVERNRILVLLKCFPLSRILISPCYTLQRLVIQLYSALFRRGASGRFIAEHSVLTAVRVLFKAWFSALSLAPSALSQRAVLRGKRRIDSADFSRMLRQFGISASEIALKE